MEIRSHVSFITLGPSQSLNDLKIVDNLIGYEVWIKANSL